MKFCRCRGGLPSRVVSQVSRVGTLARRVPALQRRGRLWARPCPANARRRGGSRGHCTGHRGCAEAQLLPVEPATVGCICRPHRLTDTGSARCRWCSPAWSRSSCENVQRRRSIEVEVRATRRRPRRSAWAVSTIVLLGARAAGEAVQRALGVGEHAAVRAEGVETRVAVQAAGGRGDVAEPEHHVAVPGRALGGAVVDPQRGVPAGRDGGAGRAGAGHESGGKRGSSDGAGDEECA